jgi:hypothetical protein
LYKTKFSIDKTSKINAKLIDRISFKLCEIIFLKPSFLIKESGQSSSDWVRTSDVQFERTLIKEAYIDFIDIENQLNKIIKKPLAGNWQKQSQCQNYFGQEEKLLQLITFLFNNLNLTKNQPEFKKDYVITKFSKEIIFAQKYQSGEQYSNRAGRINKILGYNISRDWLTLSQRHYAHILDRFVQYWELDSKFLPLNEFEINWGEQNRPKMNKLKNIMQINYVKEIDFNQKINGLLSKDTIKMISKVTSKYNIKFNFE